MSVVLFISFVVMHLRKAGRVGFGELVVGVDGGSIWNSESGGGAGKRRQRRAGYWKFSTTGIEAVESRVLLSAESVLAGTELTETQFEDYAPPTQGDEFTEDYAAYNQQYVIQSSTDFQEEAVAPGAEYLEEAAYEFAMEAAAYSSEWNETYGIEDVDTGYGEPLTISTEDSGGLPSLDGSSTSDGSLFDYESGPDNYDDSSAYAEYLAQISVTGVPEQPEAEITSGDGFVAESGSVSGTDSDAPVSATGQEQTSPPLTDSSSQSETDTSAIESEQVSSEVPLPIVPPEALNLEIPELPAEAWLDDLFSLPISSTQSYSTKVDTIAEPVVEEIPGDRPGTLEIAGSSTVTTDLHYVSPSDWELTESRITEWTSTESTIDGEGVTDGVENSSGTSMTIIVSSTGTTTVTIGEYENITHSTSEGWDNSDPLTKLVDKGWFNASVTNFRSTSASIRKTQTVVGGVPSVTLTFSAAASVGNSFSVSGGFEYRISEGTLDDFSFKSDPIVINDLTKPLNLKPRGNGAVPNFSGTGNGERTESYASLSINSGHSTSAGHSLTATTPVGSEPDESDITGTVSLNTTTTSGVSSSIGFSHDSQTFTGSVSDETDEYDYFSVGFDNGFGSAAWHIADITADVSDLDNSVNSATFSPVMPTGLLPTPATPAKTTTSASVKASLLAPPPATPVATGTSVNVGRSSSGGSGGWIDFADKDRKSTVVGDVSTSETDLLVVSASGDNAGGSSLKFRGSVDNPELEFNSSSSAAGAHKVVDDNTITVEDSEGFYVPDGSWHTSHQTIVIYGVITETYTSDGSFNFTLTVPLGDPDDFEIEDLGVTGDWTGNVTVDVELKDYYTEHSRAFDENGVLYFEARGRWGSIWIGQYTLVGAAGKVTHTSLPWHEMANVNFYTHEGQQADPPTIVLTRQQEDEAFLDDIQTKLDYAGMMPIIGEAADILNAGIHLGRGNLADAGISMISLVPGGDSAKLAKLGGKKLTSLGSNLSSKFSKISDATKKVQSKCAGSTCFIAGTQVVIAAVGDPDRVAIPLPKEVAVEPALREQAQHDRSSTAAAFMGAGLAMALARHNLKTRRHRRRFFSRKPASSGNPTRQQGTDTP